MKGREYLPTEGTRNERSHDTRGDIAGQFDPVPDHIFHLQAGSRSFIWKLSSGHHVEIHRGNVKDVYGWAGKGVRNRIQGTLKDKWRVCLGERSVELDRAKVKGL